MRSHPNLSGETVKDKSRENRTSGVSHCCTFLPRPSKAVHFSKVKLSSFLIRFAPFSLSPPDPTPAPFLKISQTVVTFPVTSWVLSQAAVQKHPSGQHMAPMELKVVTHWGHSQQVSWNLPAGQRMQPPWAGAKAGSRAQDDSSLPYSGHRLLPCSQFSWFFIRWIFV